MDFARALRVGLLVGVFLVPFIPLLVADSMIFPFITGKNIAFRVLVEILLAGWLILLLADPAYRPRRSPLLLAFAAFVGIVALADAFGVNPAKSFFSNYERMEGFVTIAHLFAYFLVASSVLGAERLWRRFFAVSVGVSVILGGIAFLQLGGILPINQGSVRVDATFGNATYFAVYALFHVFLSLLLFFRAGFPGYGRVFLAGAALLNAAILYLTATRGAILGLVGGLLLAALIVALFGRGEPRLRKAAAGVLLGILALAGGFFAAKDSAFVRENPILGRIASISLREGEARFVVWGMALEGFKERPLLGWGQENFNVVFNAYYDPRLYAQEPWFDRVHNTPLDWLIAAGSLGLLAYFALFAAALFLLWRSDRPLPERALFTGLLAGYFFHNLFVFDNLTSYLLFASVLAYLHATARPDPQERLLAHGPSGGLVRMAAPLIVVAALGAVYLFNVKPAIAARDLLQAVAPQQEGLARNLDHFKRALGRGALFGTQEIREQLAQAASRIANLNVDLATKQEFFNLARLEMERQIEAVPGDARFHLFLGALLSSYRQYDAALAAYARARELSPGKQGILLGMGSIYLNQGKTAEALGVLKEAYELAPAYEEARVAYAIAAVYAGKNDLVAELLEPVYGTVLADDNQLLKAYFDTRQYDKVIGIWQARVEKRPDEPQNRVSLAAAYLLAGNRVRAVAELRKAIELNPSFREQGEYLIREIEAGRNP